MVYNTKAEPQTSYKSFGHLRCMSSEDPFVVACYHSYDVSFCKSWPTLDWDQLVLLICVDGCVAICWDRPAPYFQQRNATVVSNEKVVAWLAFCSAFTDSLGESHGNKRNSMTHIVCGSVGLVESRVGGTHRKEVAHAFKFNEKQEGNKVHNQILWLLWWKIVKKSIFF